MYIVLYGVVLTTMLTAVTDEIDNVIQGYRVLAEQQPLTQQQTYRELEKFINFTMDVRPKNNLRRNNKHVKPTGAQQRQNQ